MIFPIIFERVDTPILSMTSRRKVFIVLGLICIRFAISLLVSPCISSSTVSCSRLVRLYRLATWEASSRLAAFLSSNKAVFGGRAMALHR